MPEPRLEKRPAPLKAARGRSAKRRPPPHERREAILSAALDVFSENGFASARLDDIARKAGVAKGTLYLYFPDKEALFEALLSGLASPVIGRIEALCADPALSIREVFERVLDVFQNEIIGTKRERLLRLVMTEGPRFPRIAEFHHREIVSRAMALMRRLATRGHERGELSSDALARFPQLFFAPFTMAVMWRSLFDRFDALDINALMACHRELILGRLDEENRK